MYGIRHCSLWLIPCIFSGGKCCAVHFPSISLQTVPNKSTIIQILFQIMLEAISQLEHVFAASSFISLSIWMFSYVFVHLFQSGKEKMENEMHRIDNHTLNTVLNWSNEVDPKLYDRYLLNKAIDEPAYTILIMMYSFLIILGTLGNLLVVSFSSAYFKLVALQILIGKLKMRSLQPLLGILRARYDDRHGKLEVLSET